MEYLRVVVRRLIPLKYRYKTRVLLRAFWYRGNERVCPCCGGHFRKFLSFPGKPGVRDVRCPRCDSLQRHRLVWLFLKYRTNFFEAPLKVLHWAPEYMLQEYLKSMPNLDYTSVDLCSDLAMVQMDITDIRYRDNSIDMIMCSHVLEHVPDDHKAMCELFRVLTPGGWAIIQVPIDITQQQTYEDPTIVTPEERERAFGQFDHLRMYGRDYKTKLESAGFTVKVDSFVRELGNDKVRLYGLDEDEDIYLCAKPDHSITEVQITEVQRNSGDAS